MDYRIATSFDGLADICKEWDEFVEDVSGSIYFSYDWCRVWWDYYGRGRALRVFVFREGKRLIGIVPLFVESLTLGPVWLRVAKLVGSDFTLQLCDPPVAEDQAGPVFDAVLGHLMGEEKCDAVRFGPVSGTYKPVAQLREVCQTRPGTSLAARRTVVTPHTAFALPGDFDSYLGSLAKSQRKKCKYELKHLRKTFDTKVDVVRDTDGIEAEFPKFRLLHDRQWQSQGLAGHFGAWPDSAAYNLALAKSQGRLGRLRLVRLIADGRIVAYQFTFAFGDCYYWRLPAREVDPPWSRFSLGRVGLTTMIELAIGEGIRRIEGGLGRYPYKVELGAQEHYAQSVLATASHLGARLRVYGFRLLSGLLNLVYHKVWFRRAAPRLPFRRRPLWRTWIRCQL